MYVVALLVAVAALALNLRPPFTAAGSLLPAITGDLGLSPAVAGLLPTLPVLCLGVFALAAPPLRRRWGDEGVIAACLPLLILGSALRAGPGVVSLFGGTIVVGAGVGIANVALPALIKREFPERVTQITSFYTVFLTLGSSVAAAAAVPLMHLGGSWRAPFLVLGALGLITALVWLPLLRSRRRSTTTAAGMRNLLRDRLAWQVTTFMGLQSLLAYVVFGWLPTLAQDRGMDPTSAGLVLSLSTLVQAGGAMCLPLMAGRRADQRGLAVGLLALSGAGLTGFVLAPVSWLWVISVVLGFAMGALFSLALSVIGLRAGDPGTAASLSSLVQAVGYALAALGPLLVGVLHDVSGGWGWPLALLLTVCALGALAGLGAGRPLHVGTATPVPEETTSKL